MVVIRRGTFFVFVLFEQPVLVIIFITWRGFEISFQFNMSKKVTTTNAYVYILLLNHFIMYVCTYVFIYLF